MHDPMPRRDDPTRDEPARDDQARIDQALRRHLERADPATGLANRLVLVEVLRSLAEPPVPAELVPAIVLAASEFARPNAFARHEERSAVLREIGAFVADSMPEGAIAASITDGVIVILVPGGSAAKVSAAAARLRALWLRRAWEPRSIARPTISVQVRPLPVRASEGGWLDRLVEASLDLDSVRGGRAA